MTANGPEVLFAVGCRPFFRVNPAQIIGWFCEYIRDLFALLSSAYFGKLPSNTRNILQTCFYGIVAGLAVVAFQWSINVLYNATFVRSALESHATFLFGSFAVMVGTAFIAGFLLNSLEHTRLDVAQAG